MTIGIIYTSYRCAEYLEASLSPWIDARRQRLGGHDWLIVAVSRPFVGFDNGPEDSTIQRLRGYNAASEIDHIIDGDTPVTEVEGRGAALKWLIEKGITISWQADGDETPTLIDIERISAFVMARPGIAWFKLSLKNYVFNTKTYLAEPFAPPRIHRVRHESYEAYSFHDDNNVLYRGTITQDMKRDTDLCHMTIPRSTAWITHFSWLSDQRSRRKQAYQWKRWGKCSFSWDDARGGLVWTLGHEQETVTE